MVYLELDRDLSLDNIYAATYSFKCVYLLLCYVTYGRVLCRQDRVLFEQLPRGVDQLIRAPEDCLRV